MKRYRYYNNLSLLNILGYISGAQRIKVVKQKTIVSSSTLVYWDGLAKDIRTWSYKNNDFLECNKLCGITMKNNVLILETE